MAGSCLPPTRWSFTGDAFDEALLAHVPCIRKTNIRNMALHMASCPRCKSDPLAVVDGKDGARRMICAGTEGSVSFEDLGIVFDTGCIKFAHASNQHCKCCASAKDVVGLIPSQTKVLGTETAEGEDGQLSTKYLVQCIDGEQESISY